MMDKTVVDPSFWELFPDGQVNIMYVSGIDNHGTDKNVAERQQLLDKATKAGQQFLTNPTFRLNPVIDQWRKAYQQFKKKKGVRSSVEALLKRASKGHRFEPIDPMVDVYNSVSMTYGVPVGMEDRDNIQGAMHLGKVDGGQAFRPVGAEDDEPTLPGEVCWYDDAGAVCRCLNWRDAQRTMLTDDSKNVVAVIESVNAEQAKRANDAMNELGRLINHYFGIDANKIKIFHLTKDAPEAVVPDELK
ncbi:B3/4 domain-containing protein [Limosilactobacillus sp.]|jgi:DNA/RNA-binding domain of Phe-tRNA-synthetase-like protein|uniref:B3/B4 domain-containing protein n=1 Tax=Limosilactobacillus sp. TaxID=2773925 RepID=UPI00359F5DC6